ncbi:MAG: DUF721 domain-containing protein [Treponema sp.]|nr:DUF721 domain-containing protein [Treponema sp.]
MNKENFINGQELITKFFDTIDVNKMKEGLDVANKWKQILSSIKENNYDEIEYSAGKKMADHSRVVDLKNGILLIETDHPGWTQKIQFHKNYIMIGLKNAFPCLEINTFAFKLKGDKKILYNIEKNKNTNIIEKEKKQKLIKKEILKEIDEKMTEIPEDLAKILNKLKDSILTKE